MSKSKRRKKKAAQRGTPPTASAVATAARPRSAVVDARTNDQQSAKANGKGETTPLREEAAIPWFARPPARNVPLLVFSIVLLVVWLSLLIWLALTVRGQRDTIKGVEGSGHPVGWVEARDPPIP
jgi:hypothetical protein